MLLANILLAITWGALQGDISPANLIIGFILGYLVLGALSRGFPPEGLHHGEPPNGR